MRRRRQRFAGTCGSSWATPAWWSATGCSGGSSSGCSSCPAVLADRRRSISGSGRPRGSPLLVISRAQARGLEAELNRREPGRFKVALGMRYGSPSIATAVQELREWGADHLLLFPMYPQYAGPTTASTYDEVFKQLSMLRFVPSLRVVPPYYDHPAYIEALTESVREAMTSRPRPPEKVVISFHGIPQSFVDSGDPYASHCEATAKSLARGPDGTAART
jgi:ferrochelatase